MSLVEFLRARINEDERHTLAFATRCDDGPEDPHSGFAWPPPEMDGPPYPHPVMVVGYARVLAECAAKRRLIEHETASHILQHDTPWAEQFYAKGAHGLIGQYGEVIASNPADVEALIRGYSDAVADTPVLRIMALAYATHPDYDTEWAPH